MLRQIMVLTLLVCLFGSSCNTSQEKTLLRKATKVHQESATIEADINQKLKELIQKKNSINIQGRALTTEELTFVDIIENLESTYNRWRENYETSATMHALSQEKAQAPGPGAYGGDSKFNAKDVYANQVTLHEGISDLKEQVEQTYERWINEV